MLDIDPHSRVAIYEQIKTQIMELIAVGALKPHAQLPSIRALASELSLNFNTVKKAFGELESAGVIYTLAGRGCFVADGALKSPALREKAARELRDGAQAARAAGLTAEDARAILEEVYSQTIQTERRELHDYISGPEKSL